MLFCTEPAAFVAAREESFTRNNLAAYFDERKDGHFNGDEIRALFTGVPRDEDPDGERVLTFTHNGKKGLNEASSFRVTLEADERKVKFDKEVRTR